MPEPALRIVNHVLTAPSLFSQHDRQWSINRYVYPVISRRSKGLSIGINLNLDKRCNFDCVYCSVDRSTANDAISVDMNLLREELDETLALTASRKIFAMPPFDRTPPALRRLSDVAFSGDGEPTLFAGFGDACHTVADSLARHRLRKTKVVVITNASLLHVARVKKALTFLDHHHGEIWAKLDGVMHSHYQRISRSHVPALRVLVNILTTARVRPIVIQSMFVKINDFAPSPDEIAAYVDRLEDLVHLGARIKLVQIYTTARAPAEPGVSPLRDQELDCIVEQVRGKGLSAEPYYGISAP